MATPVIDLRERLRRAGMPEDQARAIAAAFEALDRRLDRLEARQRLHTALLTVIAAAVLAPYVDAPFRMG